MQRCRPVLVDDKLARSTHESSGGGARGGGSVSEDGFTSELLDGLDVAASHSYRQESGPRDRRDVQPFPVAPEKFGITTDTTIAGESLR